MRLVDSITAVPVSRIKAVGFARAGNIAPLYSHFEGKLEHGRAYTVEVQAENRAGGRSEWVASDGFIVDLTPPVLSAISVSPAVVSWQVPRLTIEWNSADAESGIAECVYALGTVAGGSDAQDWTRAPAPTGSSSVRVLPSQNGIRWEVTERVRATRSQSSPI